MFVCPSPPSASLPICFQPLPLCPQPCTSFLAAAVWSPTSTPASSLLPSPLSSLPFASSLCFVPWAQAAQPGVAVAPEHPVQEGRSLHHRQWRECGTETMNRGPAEVGYRAWVIKNWYKSRKINLVYCLPYIHCPRWGFLCLFILKCPQFSVLKRRQWAVV